jgi:hypothetical protein
MRGPIMRGPIMRGRLTPLAALAVAALVAGCSSAAASGTHRASTHNGSPHGTAQQDAAPAASPLSLVSSVQTAGATWATIPMGATAGPNEFWQLFTRPAGSPDWRLETPPGIATNGALVLAGTGATLTAGIRPSIDLTFSPVTGTSDGGKTWTTSPPQAGLADHPDALAAAPDGHLIAAGQDHQISVLAPGGVSWSELTSENALSTVAGCGLTSVSAVAYTPSGEPLVAGTCRQTGTAGVLVKSASGWGLAGLSLPASLQSQPVQVLRLTRTSAGDVALLQARTSLVAAWSGDGRHWSVSTSLAIGGASPASVSFGVKNSVAVALTGGRAQTVSGPGGAWTELPTLPSVAAGHSVALALPMVGGTEALAAGAGALTVYQLAGARWVKAQVIKVPIQYGSSSGS